LRRRIIKGALLALYFLCMHVLIFGVLPFSTALFIGESGLDYDVESMLSEAEETTYAGVLDERGFSFDARVALIESAESSIEISSFSASDGETLDTIAGALYHAAEDGVDIRLLFDGLAHTVTLSDYRILHTLNAHENIDIRWFEPPNPLLPYTIQNRMHDKMFIIDETYATSGGRNINDRYFREDPDSGTFDRDVYVFGDGAGHSTVTDMRAYFDTLFESDYTIAHPRDTVDEEILTSIEAARIAFLEEKDPEMIMKTLKADAHEVKNATFVHGPTDRGKKDPVVLKTMSALAEERDEWFAQSPYIVFSRTMRHYLPEHDDQSITLLTNNIAKNPNPWGAGAYLRHRQSLAEHTLYEFQSPASLHAKSMTFGDDISAIGALNMDPRSAFLSTENMVVVVGEAFTEDFHSTLDYYKERSLEVDEDGSYQDGPPEAYTPSIPRMISLRMRQGIAHLFDYMF